MHKSTVNLQPWNYERSEQIHILQFSVYVLKSCSTVCYCSTSFVTVQFSFWVQTRWEQKPLRTAPYIIKTEKEHWCLFMFILYICQDEPEPQYTTSMLIWEHKFITQSIPQNKHVNLLFVDWLFIFEWW